jgi:hypothetical protein
MSDEIKSAALQRLLGMDVCNVSWLVLALWAIEVLALQLRQTNVA